MPRPYLLVFALILWPRLSFAQCDAGNEALKYESQWSNESQWFQLAPCRDMSIRRVNAPATVPATTSVTQNGSTLSEPILGLVPGDNPGEVLIIRGAPSSATLSVPVWGPAQVNQLFIPPHQAFVLAETTSPETIGILTVQGGNLSTPALIPGGMTGADLVSFSPDGAVAILYRAATNSLQVITGLPALPTIALDISVRGLLGPALKTAVSDDASIVLCLTSDGLYNISDQGAATLLHNGTGAGNLAFLPHSSIALLWDGGQQALVQINGSSANVVASNVSLSAGALLEVSADARFALMADASSSSVTSIDLSTGALTQIPADRGASALKSLRVPNLFLLSAETENSARVLFLDGSGARNYGVPRLAPVRRIVPLTQLDTSAAPSQSPDSTVKPRPARRTEQIPEQRNDFRRATTLREEWLEQ